MPMISNTVLGPPVWYLEDSDINGDGSLAVDTNGKTAMVMIQGNFCGHCTRSKGDFQKLADAHKGEFYFGTVNVDGARQSEKALGKRLQQIPSYQFDGSVPHYVKIKNGKVIPYDQGRDYQSLLNFARD